MDNVKSNLVAGANVKAIENFKAKHPNLKPSKKPLGPDYNVELSKDAKKNIAEKPNVNTPPKKVETSTSSNSTSSNSSSSLPSVDTDNVTDIATEAVDTSQNLEKVEKVTKAKKVAAKEVKDLERPGIFFLGGLEVFGNLTSGSYDGVRDLTEAVEGARFYGWDQQDDILEQVKIRAKDQPIILVGHSLGGDTAVEIAQKLNTAENGYRKVDLLVTLDSVGWDNDYIPQNVVKNLNFISEGNGFFKDGPNVALNYERTEVKNYLRPESHTDLDDSVDIQIEILDAINDIIW